MHSDLQHLVKLQDLDLSTERLRRRIADMPEARAALEARMAERAAAVAAAREQLAANQTARREIEKDLAAVQGRLSKYKDQLMAVKTNKEYQAMLTEISVAEGHVRAHEDRLLDRMEETDTITAELKRLEEAWNTARSDAVREREALDAEIAACERELERITLERSRVAGALSPEALALFEHVSRQRKGLAVSEAREGHCMQCHVRLRPQVFNDVRRNDSLLQCESCLRILYYQPPVAGRESAVHPTADSPLPTDS